MLSKETKLQVLVSGISLGLLASSINAQISQGLPEGTPVRMKINRTVSSSSVHQGDNVDFQTLDDIKVNDAMVIPKGSTAIATVTEAVPKGRMGKGGKLDMNIDYIRMPSGDKLALRGVQQLKGGGHGGAMTGGMVATAIVFWPAAPLFLFMHGKDITIPEGHEITVYTNSEYKLPQSVVSNAGDSRVLSGSALHNSDIEQLKSAGFSEELILARIKSSRGAYDLGTDDLVRLKAVGLSDNVIAAMLGASSH